MKSVATRVILQAEDELPHATITHMAFQRNGVAVQLIRIR